jgi:hypothetical protein
LRCDTIPAGLVWFLAVMDLERDPHVMPSRHALDVYWSSAPTNPLNHLAAALYHTGVRIRIRTRTHSPPRHCMLHAARFTLHTAHCTLYFGPLVTVGGSGQLWSSPRTPHLLNPSPLLPSPDRTHYQATACLCPCRVVSTPVKLHPHRIQSQTQTSLAEGPPNVGRAVKPIRRATPCTLPSTLLRNNAT